MDLFERVFAALNEASGRYVVVGGVATVLHGHARLTADVDLVVDLTPAEALKVMRALSALGLVPRAPVKAEQFADPAQRKVWVEDKGMRVFSLWDPQNPLQEVDVFVDNPIPFDELYARSEEVTLSRTTTRIAAIPDLIRLKSLAGRPQDLQDIEALQSIAQRTKNR